MNLTLLDYVCYANSTSRQNHICSPLGMESLKMWNTLLKLTHCSRSRSQRDKLYIFIYFFILNFTALIHLEGFQDFCKGGG